MEEAIELLEELLDEWDNEGTLGDEVSVAKTLQRVLNLLIEDLSREDY